MPPDAASTPLVSDAISVDLSGLEVHDIEESPEAPPMLSTPVYYRHSMFSQNRPRRRWRWRLMRWAAAVAVIFAIVFFALLGEAVFIHTFPTLDEVDLRLPAAPASPRVSATSTPVPIPADVTQAPPISDQPAEELAVEPDAVLPVLE
jgi:hypothetical protein